MATARRIGVGVFVDQDQSGMALQRAVEIELLQGPLAVGNGRRGKTSSREAALGVLTPVGLDQAHGDVAALRLSGVRAARSMS